MIQGGDPTGTGRHRPKRVKVEEVVDGDREGGAFSASAAMSAAAVDNGEKGRSDRTPSRSQQKPKAIKQALEEPHPASEHCRETYKSIEKLCSCDGL